MKVDGAVKADDGTKVENDLKVNDGDREYDRGQKINENKNVETIFATAVISNTNESQINPVHYQGLRSIFSSKDHLCKNLASIYYRGFNSYKQSSGKYEHFLQIVFDVRTAYLWENPRSYLFHHLGRNTWTLNDGTTIQFVRIHQKR